MRKHPAVGLVSQVTQALDDAGRIKLIGLSGTELDAVIADHFVVISRLRTHLTEALEQADSIDRAAELAAPNLTAWLCGRFGQTPRDAAQLVRDMKDLRSAPIAAEAALLGAIPIQSAAAIGHSVAKLPPEVGPEVRADGADVLLGLAIGRDGPALDARELGLVGRRLHEVLDPEAADQLLADRLEREEADAWDRRFLSITDDLGGGVRLRGLLSTEAGAILRAVLDPLAAPRPAQSLPEESTGVSTGSASTDDHEAGSTNEPPAVRDGRTGGQRLADALTEAAERLLAHGELPDTAGQRPQLLVTLDHDRLAAGLGVGTLADGNQLPPSTIRRLACDAGVIPAVLGTAGQVLDLGRTARTAAPAQRRALAVRDRGCRFPGCDRPPGWTDAHHIQTWDNLGPTDLDNLVLLCGFHHLTVHHDGWEVSPGKAGMAPLFAPPPWIDPGRTPRRNLVHHTRDLLRSPAPVG